MASREYPRLEISQFGHHLLDSEDLDPIYTALHRCGLEREQLARWLVAYWCFYHAGAASHMSELTGSRYWEEMSEAAINIRPTLVGGRWPRGSERRHFRGESAIRAVRELREAYPQPIRLVEKLAAAGPDYADVRRAVKRHYKFGDWIAFKVGDMLERVWGAEVCFASADVFMFKAPTEGAVMLWNRMNLARLQSIEEGRVEDPETHQKVKVAVQWMQSTFGKRSAPPGHERQVNLQEIETILCKWKSHMGGHYPLNNDINEIREGLEPWAECDTARLFLSQMPLPLERRRSW